MIRRFVDLNRRVARRLEVVWPKVFGGESYKRELERRVFADLEGGMVGTILEVGGIDRPLLRKSANYCYIGLDIEEQPLCYDVYDRFVVQSVEQPIPFRADLITSITLLEHVRDNSAAVRSMSAALNDNGTTHHYVPSKWHPYAVATRLVGPSLQRRLIRLLRPAAIDVTGYRAFYDRCSPRAMAALFGRHGLVDIQVKAYYRANDYFAFFLPAYVAVSLLEDLAAALGLRFLASGFVISARKPAQRA